VIARASGQLADEGARGGSARRIRVLVVDEVPAVRVALSRAP
jgi:hypothetical protein